MKKLLLLLAAVGFVFLTSCKDDKNDGPLSGTTWKMQDATQTFEVKFTSNEAFHKHTSASGTLIASYEGIYAYTSSGVIIEITTGDWKGYWEVGDLNGDTMILNIPQGSSLGSSVTLKKQ